MLLTAANPAASAQAKLTAPPPAIAAQSQPKFQPVPVEIDGKKVIEIAWGVGSISSEIRAKAITERLIKLSRDTSQTINLTTNQADTSVDVMQGDLILASVFDGDAAAAGTSREQLARTWQTAFAQTAVQYRAEHSRERMFIRVGLTLLVLVLTLFILWLLIPVTRWLASLTSKVLFGRLARSKRESWSLIDTQQLEGFLRLGFSTARWAASFFVIYLALQLLFSIFPQTRPLGERMLEGVMRPARQFGRSAWNSAPSLFFILIIAVVCRYLLRLVSFAFVRIGEGHVRIEGFKPQWAAVTARLVNIALILLAVLIAYPYIPGSESAAFKGFSLFLGVLVSLGSTGVVANVFNGIVLTYMDSFQI